MHKKKCSSHAKFFERGLRLCPSLHNGTRALHRLIEVLLGLGHSDSLSSALFFWSPFFLVVGWCRLELWHFSNLWQEKTRIADELRVLQHNTPFGA